MSHDSHDNHSSHDDHGHGGHGGHAHPTPIARFGRMLSEDRSDLWVLLIYTVVAGLMALAVPLAAQALVNNIAANVLLQPVFVLAFLVFLGTSVSGGLQLLQLSLVERLQQRFFARTALRLADHLPRVRGDALHGEYAPELVNRFFDVLTVQKAISKLFLDGLAALLQALVGLVLLAIYSPLLLGFDFFLIAFIAVVTFGLGMGGLRSSIKESKEKYRVADWLEDIARCQTSMKLHGSSAYLFRRADEAVLRYVTARKSHFRVIWRQALGGHLFQAVASTGILALGGWLVINRQLTLGQLVASQIIVVGLLASVQKLISQFEKVYDLLTGLDKIGHVTDLAAERRGGKPIPALSGGGASVAVRNVRFSYAPESEVLTGLSLSLEPGQRVSLVGASGAGKSTLAALLCGLEEPSHGSITINGVEVRAANLSSLRRAVTVVGYNNEIFDGTVEENVRVGRDWLSHEDVRWALDVAQLTNDISLMSRGIETHLISGGQNLSRGQIQRLLIARAVAARPALLILDEAFTGIDERTSQKILEAVFDTQNEWSIIDISHDAEVVLRAGTIHVLADGRILESGRADDLARRETGEFSALFPHLCTRLRREGGAVAGPQRSDAAARPEETA